MRKRPVFNIEIDKDLFAATEEYRQALCRSLNRFVSRRNILEVALGWLVRGDVAYFGPRVDENDKTLTSYQRFSARKLAENRCSRCWRKLAPKNTTYCTVHSKARNNGESTAKKTPPRCSACREPGHDRRSPKCPRRVQMEQMTSNPQWRYPPGRRSAP